MNETKILKAPFPYFGGKSKAASLVWSCFGEIQNYVEPFAGSIAMLLASPHVDIVETINDFDGFVSNFWRSIAKDPDSVAIYADWPCNENDLFARHSWLVSQKDEMNRKLHSDHEYFDVKIAGFWVWGLCNWIGSGFCSGNGPWLNDNGTMIKCSNAGQGINRQLPHLGDAGQGINRQLPHLGDAGRGINRQLPHLGNAGRGINRTEFIKSWFNDLSERLRDVRVASGDWERVVRDSVTTRHGVTGLFLDPPYDKGSMDYGSGGMGIGISANVRSWCIENMSNPKLKIILCGHKGEHDELLSHGWFTKSWKAGGGYALTESAIENYNSETIWCSPLCIEFPEKAKNDFEEFFV